FASLRQFRRDLTLRPPQDEGADRACKDRELLGLALWPSDGRRLEGCRRPAKTRIEELEEAPQLTEMVLDRRAAQCEPMPAFQQTDRLRRSRCRILHRLRLIQDQVVEIDVFQDRDIAPQRAVCREYQIESLDLAEVAGGACRIENGQLRRKAPRLLHPVENERARQHRER